MPVLKEIHHLMKNLTSISNGQAKVVKFEHPKNTIDVYIELSPNDGLYKGGNFLFIIRLFANFPEHSHAEAIKCMTPIYHPNIDTFNANHYESNVCLNVIDDGQGSLGLIGLVAALLYLLYNPQLDDPLAEGFDGITMEQFQTNVKSFMSGECVESFQPRLLEENMEDYSKQEQEDEIDPDLNDEVSRQEETMDTDDDVTPLENAEAMQLYSLMLHQNSIVKLDDVACASVDCDSRREITPFSAPEHFKEEFNGHKLTKHGTTVIREKEVPTSNASSISPLFFLTKRYTA